jgi:hypothetical protein
MDAVIKKMKIKPGINGFVVACPVDLRAPEQAVADVINAPFVTGPPQRFVYVWTTPRSARAELYHLQFEVRDEHDVLGFFSADWNTGTPVYIAAPTNKHGRNQAL